MFSLTVYLQAGFLQEDAEIINPTTTKTGLFQGLLRFLSLVQVTLLKTASLLLYFPWSIQALASPWTIRYVK